jgi:hypothetical protein
LTNTHSLLSGWAAYYISDVKMFGEKVKIAVMGSKLMSNSNKALLFTYAVHKKGSSHHWKKIFFFCRVQ